MKSLIIVGVLIAIVLAIVLPIAMWAINVSNEEVGLRNQFNANEDALGVIHDNMWKTIKEKYNIADSYKDGLIKVIGAAADGRKGGSLFKSVTEAMPGLSENCYKEVMATVEGKRNELKTKSETIIDIVRVHTDLRTKFWSSFIVGSRPALVAKLITSTRTREAQESGVDNEPLVGEK